MHGQTLSNQKLNNKVLEIGNGEWFALVLACILQTKQPVRIFLPYLLSCPMNAEEVKWHL